MFFYDTETCGFHGMPVLLQYARDEGEIVLHDIWSKEIGETLDLIEEMIEEGVCGYNLTFDHFHLSKLYTTFDLLPRNKRPESIIHDVYLAEEQGRFGKCLKPRTVIDLMINVQKSKYQQAMGKRVWTLKKVHKSIAKQTVDYLNRHTKLDHYLHTADTPIWESKIIKDKKKRWIDKDFRNIEGRNKSSFGLKTVCTDIFKLPVHHFKEVMPGTQPVELGYIPYAKGIVDMEGWPTNDPPKDIVKEYKSTWPLHINLHKLHWMRSLPRKYAREDVEWTRKLYHYFEDPEETHDHVLTCSVASARWRGFDLDLERLKNLKNEIEGKINREIVAPAKAQRYLSNAMDDLEIKTFMEGKDTEGSTSAETLEILCTWKDICDKCLENESDGCENCGEHEVAKRAKEIIKARKLASKCLMYKKLLLSSRLHPGFNVIGTKTSRMSGSGGLNPQGIESSDEMRECFTFAGKDQWLVGGDFSGFELSIADPVYKDPNWHNMLKGDQKAHGLFAADLFGITYEEAMKDQEYYGKGKGGQFLVIYGGDAGGLQYKMQVTKVRAEAAYNGFFKRFPKFLVRREQIYRDFRPLTESYTWNEPLSYIESFLGHRRYFDLEWSICRVLFELGREIESFRWDRNMMVERYEGNRQTIGNSLKSATLGSIRKIQKKASRAALNTEVQSPGADITKMVQKTIGDLQPVGIHEWKVQSINVHDEVICVVHEEPYVEKVEKIVKSKILELRSKVPLLKMEWGSGNNWRDIH